MHWSKKATVKTKPKGKIKIALLSDIHGNSWALEKVLDDIHKRQPCMILNLGDTYYGPLDPKGTHDLIKSIDIISISGNEDRLILEKDHTGTTMDYVRKEISDVALDWLASLQDTIVPVPGIFICHGSPSSDITYLTEQISDGHVTSRSQDELQHLVQGVNEMIIFCGHSHIQRVVQIPGKVIVNPGSVGCPAFEDEFPVYHRIENFCNFARYSLVDLNEGKISIDQVAVPYDTDKAVCCALKNNRPDWAKWLKTGRV
ncbi:MAG: metallophosphoesterase family protein [bacterium]